MKPDTIFTPGRLVRAQGENPTIGYYLILTHITVLPGKRMDRNKYMTPSYYEAIGPEGTVVELPDDAGIWEIIA
jgi:hypothetical protein